MVNTDEFIEIESKPYGKIKIQSKQKVTFEEGLYGFEREKVFYLLDMDEEGPFYYLQSSSCKELAFLLVNPYTFKNDFVLDVSINDLKKIGLKGENDANDKLLVFSIVTIPDDPKDMTANLLGPILINAKKRLGIQALSLVESYTTKHKILDELNNSSKAGD